jgi:ABC-type multidrug transport system fused ATPase/permease subunit
MNPNTFKIVPGSDKEYVDAFEKMRAEGAFAFEKATLGEFSDLPAADFQKNQGLQEVLAQGMRVFPNLAFHFPGQFSVRITRSTKAETLFDEVSVNRPDRADQVTFAKLVATVQKHLGQSSLLNIGNLLGPAATQHFEAREIALARLEKMSATLLEEMEVARKRREQEYEAKEKALEARIEQKGRELDEAAKAKQEEQDRRAAELEALRKELDDRAAKHARRQHYKDIKEKFRSWSETFQVTAGTKSLRRSVFWFTLLLMALFGGLAGWFLFQTFAVQDSTLMVAAIVKQVAFTVLFVSTAYFFIRWNNQWFQRHANEEFRLKRMELDIDRASWFVEMAFEWKEEKGEEIPLELIDRLTQGLFGDERGDHPVEPADSLAQALLGAARFKVKLADGTEAEYDRKGIEKLIRKSSTKKKES